MEKLKLNTQEFFDDFTKKVYADIDAKLVALLESPGYGDLAERLKSNCRFSKVAMTTEQIAEPNPINNLDMQSYITRNNFYIDDNSLDGKLIMTADIRVTLSEFHIEYRYY